MEKSRFRFSTQVRVRHFEIDWQGIVHNANYLLYFELARIEYLKHVGVAVDSSKINNEAKVVIVRNELDYNAPARFDDLLNVFIRLSYIRNSSFAFEGIIENALTGVLVAENRAIHVWLDPETNEPKRVDDDFRRLIQVFEGDNLELTDSPSKSQIYR
jgi:acyl-CoA thioester hydrolase